MPSVSEKQYKDVLAILTGDWHLSHDCPVFRSAEPSWYAAMRRAVRQVIDLASEYNAPIIIAGDLFHHWRQPPELINFVISMLRDCNVSAIPGNHDLPHHNYDDINKSAYGTLASAGVIGNYAPNTNYDLFNFTVHGFPCGYDVRPCVELPYAFGLNIAVAHSYIWQIGAGYIGASENAIITAFKKRLQGYDVAHFGDNHICFQGAIKYKDIKMPVFNSGTLMIRRADEVDYKPSVGILHRWGKVTKHQLDTSQDKYFTPEVLQDMKEGSPQLARFITELGSLGSGACDFVADIHRGLDSGKVRKEVRKIVLQSMEKKK